MNHRIRGIEGTRSRLSWEMGIRNHPDEVRRLHLVISMRSSEDGITHKDQLRTNPGSQSEFDRPEEGALHPLDSTYHPSFPV